MKSICVIAAISLSSSTAFAQGAPKVGDKPLVQIIPKGSSGCKLVGTVKGTKLWAGDCVASEPAAPIITETRPGVK